MDKNQAPKDGTVSTGTPTDTDSDTSKEKAPEVFTAKQVESMIDRRVTQALQTAQDKVDVDAIEKDRADAAKKAEADGDWQAQVKNLRAEVLRNKTDADTARRDADTSGMLVEKDASHLACVFKMPTGTLEERGLLIDDLDQVIKKRVEIEVAERLKSSAPPSGNSQPGAPQSDGLIAYPGATK